MDEILQLSALAPERDKAHLKWTDNPDGLIVELAVREDFGLLEYQRMARLAEEIDKLLAVERPTPAQSKRVDTIIDDITGRLLVGAPPEAVTQLPQMIKQDVIAAFFARVKAHEMGTIAAALQKRESSSLDSSDSTEETPSGG